MIDSAGCAGDAASTINGDDVWVWGVEVTSSDPSRVRLEAGSNPVNYRRMTGVNFYGVWDKLINAGVHDTATGVGMWDQATDTELYGTVISDVGWVGPDRGHGHGVYVQNQTGAGKQIIDTIVLDSYDIGVHAYATAGHVIGVHFDGLVIADSGRPAATSATDPIREPTCSSAPNRTRADDVTVANSVFYLTRRDGRRRPARRLTGVPAGAVVDHRQAPRRREPKPSRS